MGRFGCSGLGRGLAQGRVVNFCSDLGLFYTQFRFNQGSQPVQLLFVKFVLNLDLVDGRRLDGHL